MGSTPHGGRACTARFAGRATRLALAAALTLAIGGCESCDDAPTLKPVLGLRVATFNILTSEKAAWAPRRSAVVDTIAGADLDVVGIQEARRGQVLDLASDLDGYRWVGVGRDDGMKHGEHAAIFYREDRFEVLAHKTFWFSLWPDSWGSNGPHFVWGEQHHPRICTWARFREKSTGKQFYFYNLHLEHGDHGAMARKSSVNLLAERVEARVAPLPAVIVGDFNATPGSEPMKTDSPASETSTGMVGLPAPIGQGARVDSRACSSGSEAAR